MATNMADGGHLGFYDTVFDFEYFFSCYLVGLLYQRIKAYDSIDLYKFVKIILVKNSHLLKKINVVFAHLNCLKSCKCVQTTLCY